MTRISHTFLEKGHTETENDSIHATTERASCRIELYIPEQWFAAVRGSRTSKKRYRVKEMLSEDFFDFKTMSSSAKNMSTDDNGEKIMWSKTRQLVVSIEDPSAMLISTAYGGILKRLDLHRRSRRSSDAAAILESIPLAKGLRKHGIVPAKKKDLLSLCDTRQIPQSYRGYFDSLPVRTDHEDPEED